MINLSHKNKNFSRLFLLLLIFFITINYLFADIKSNSPIAKVDSLKSITNTQEFQVYDVGVQKIDRKNYNLQIWIGSKKKLIKNISVELVITQSPVNKLFKIPSQVVPKTLDITPRDKGVIFTLHLDSSKIQQLEPGDYKAFVLIKADQMKPFIHELQFEKLSSKNLWYFYKEGIQWIRDNLLLILWNILEIMLVLFLFVFILRFIFIRFYLLKTRSLKVLPIVNETGNDNEYQGVASGIDDILMTKLQSIVEMSKVDELKQYWLPVSDSGSVGKSQNLSVVGGEVSLQLQKLGDVSIGPIKIPLGTITSVLLKVFGGYYLTGALQKYGKYNKLILSLENRPSIFEKENLTVQYFEVTWPSETVKESKLEEGVPQVIEELSYQIVLALSKNIGTDNWQAYKYFLRGNELFSNFEKNRKRLDLLKDTIAVWRESVRFDPDFAKTHYNLGVALDMQRKYQDAIFRYQKAILLSPDLIGTEAHYNLAKIYWDIFKDTENTLKELRKAKSLNPTLPDIYNLEGLVYLKNQNYKQAESLFREAISHSQTPNPIYHYNLCVTDYYLERYKDGQKEGEESIKIYGNKSLPENLLQTMGWTHLQKGLLAEQNQDEKFSQIEYQQALTYLQKGLEIRPESRDMLDAYGRALCRNGQLEKALIIQRRLIRLWPEYGLGYEEFAKTLSLIKSPDAEIKAYHQIAQILANPDNLSSIDQIIKSFKTNSHNTVEGLIFSATLASILYYKFQFYNDAIIYFDQVIQQKTNADNLNITLKAEFYHNYGRALKKVGRIEDAVFVYEVVIQLYSRSQYYDLAQNYFELSKAYNELIRKSLYIDAKFDIIRPNYLKALRNFENAIQFFKQANLLKRASEIHVSKAELQIDIGRKYGDKFLNLAREECNKAIQLFNSNADAFHIKGNSYYYQENYEEAIPQYEKSIELNFNLPGPHYNLGLCYYFLGKYNLAITKFKTAINLDEYYENAYKYLIRTYVKQDREDKAVNTLKKAIRIFPNNLYFSFRLGKLLKEQEKYSEAVEELRISLNLEKRNNEHKRHLILNELADILTITGANLREATDYTWEAIKICKSTKGFENDLQKTRNTLGWICYQKGQYKRAIILMENTLSQFLNDPERHHRLAKACDYHAELNQGKESSYYKKRADEYWGNVLKLAKSEALKKEAELRLGI